MEEEIPELNRKQKEEVFVEIESCKKNIDFYREQIQAMEGKIQELERIKKAYEYY